MDGERLAGLGARRADAFTLVHTLLPHHNGLAARDVDLRILGVRAGVRDLLNGREAASRPPRDAGHDAGSGNVLLPHDRHVALGVARQARRKARPKAHGSAEAPAGRLDRNLHEGGRRVGGLPREGGHHRAVGCDGHAARRGPRVLGQPDGGRPRAGGLGGRGVGDGERRGRGEEGREPGSECARSHAGKDRRRRALFQCAATPPRAARPARACARAGRARATRSGARAPG